MFFLLTLPFRIAFGLFFGLLFLPFALLIVPFMLLRLLIKSMVLAGGAAFRAAGRRRRITRAFVAVLFAVMIPLLPFAFLALFAWAIIRLTSRPSLSY
jgi:hypothetical protein